MIKPFIRFERIIPFERLNRLKRLFYRGLTRKISFDIFEVYIGNINFAVRQIFFFKLKQTDIMLSVKNGKVLIL